MATRKLNTSGELRLKSTGLKPPTTTTGLCDEYVESLKILCEENMIKACELLLSERDYQHEEEAQPLSTADKSDLEQLDDMYQLCRRAASVIEKEASAVLPWMPVAVPVQRTAAAMALLASKRGAPANKPTVPTKNIIPNRRMARLPPTRGISNKRAPLERASFTEPSSLMTTHHPSKKIRTMTVSNKSSSIENADNGDNNTPPPPSALLFLAKLNKDKGANIPTGSLNNDTPAETVSQSSTDMSNKQEITAPCSVTKQVTNAHSCKSAVVKTSNKKQTKPSSPPTRTLPSRVSRIAKS